ncbi:Mn transporter [candidate division WOR-1 bacterium RIFOXYB2_FULL_42_35]|uniref:Mn transporter n=1 Tax=candidate division WOR-1 bacterium RIFOXYC2_FULL_41_25 TaxID=1802586 RepID=A0A1F4TNS4_UNCSA|nr:MAG: Mn transporter [candidate division WOR-1 bacterium RIFOXYA2_FULL_41_14]OGC24779.1 MAG: Mn transporter [candidate division WOR-1 bacterium RIFOXYB2_FULL_42_35]OGC34338.1 MAG: Mn transporter [candidate division WOR-1 bacterium RIFOXYC2_FULL_41_25]OGC42705.1 MAG: Mn transporter [candidate division WOR-1 bacterium RIFOXYD2_FULL_41_8]
MRLPKFKKFWLFLIVLGPGLIAALAGNDAGGTATYSIVGAHYGYHMLWMLILVGVALVVIQEMCARMGVVTGKGLSDLIREEFGVRWTFFAMLILLIANIAVTISEFAGIAASLEIFGITRYFSVPVMLMLIWVLMTRGTYKGVERIFIAVCFIYFAYIFSGFMARPDWGMVLKSTVVPSFRFDQDYILLSIAMIGTTIAPWMQFYLQSSVVEKGIKIKQYNYQRWDVILGSIIAVIIAFFIVIACAAVLYPRGIIIHEAEEAAVALKPFAGNFAATLFALGLFASSTLGASILPLSSSYAICEAFGWENGISKKFNEAPIFFGLYTLLILIGAGVVLIPNLNLVNVMVFSQTTNGILFPFLLIFMLLLVNNKRLMGSYVNSRFNNAVAWTTAGVLIFLTILLLFATVTGRLG